MVAPASDYRPLLGGGLWLAGTASVAAILYAIGASSSIASALAFEYFLVAIATWIARDLHQKRDFAANNPSSSDLNPKKGPDPLQARHSKGSDPFFGQSVQTPPNSSIDPGLLMKDGGHSPPCADSAEAARVEEPQILSAEAEARGPNDVRAAVQSRSTVLICVATVVGLLTLLQFFQLTPNETRMADDEMAIGIGCLAISFVWLVLARSFQAIREDELPEAPPLMAAFRESQWCTSIAAVGLIGTSVEPLLLYWATRLILIWIVAICLETVLRLVATLVIPSDHAEIPVAPIHLLLREAVFTAANPIASLVRTFENRCGVSLRSSWAISFVRNAMLPLLVFFLLLSWSLTSLVIVETNLWAVREHFGRIVGDPLQPGLHLTLPWPFGKVRTFPVKTVQQLPIGYVEADQSVDTRQPRALLWTKPHAKEEFALALGDGSELVAVNALVYFKISEVRDEFLDYVYQQSSPEDALIAFAYRAFMEETRGRTLDDVLSANRAAFARRVAESVRRQAKEARLGLEVVDLALLNLHPPIEAGAEYLEVINARLDARRRVTEAEGEKQVALLEAKSRGAMAVAAARIHASRRVAGALSELAEFKAVGEGLQATPRTLRTRLWIEALENALVDQRLFLVDHTLLDDGGELILDTRRYDARRMPELDAPSPTPLPGPNQHD